MKKWGRSIQKKFSGAIKLIGVSLVVGQLLAGAVEARDWSKIKGKYRILPDAPEQETTDKVEIVEFLSFYCGHCYKFFLNEPVLKGRYPGKVKFKYVPIHWGDASSKPTEAYLIAKELGKGSKMKAALFRAAFEKGKDISKPEIVEEISISLGFGKDFIRRLRSGEKGDEVKKNIELARRLSVNETPTFIIGGNIVVSSGMIRHGGPGALSDNIEGIVGALLGKK